MASRKCGWPFAPYTLDKAARITGIPAEKIGRAAEIYARGPNTSSLWAMGLTQHTPMHRHRASFLNLMLACGMIGRWGAAMLPIRGQNNVQGASDMGAIPFVYTDYQPVGDTAVRARFCQGVGVVPESLSLKKGLMVTEVVKPESGIRGMYIMGENPSSPTPTSRMPSIGSASSSSSRSRICSSPRLPATPT